VDNKRLNHRFVIIPATRGAGGPWVRFQPYIIKFLSLCYWNVSRQSVKRI